MKITFGKFDGSVKDEGTADILLDGGKVGYIERDLQDVSHRTERFGARMKVVGYVVQAWDGEAAGPLLPLDGRSFESLAKLKSAVRDAYAPVSVSLWRPEATRGVVLGRFTSIKEAEAFVAKQEKTDPDGVYRGDYSIDAPEGMLS